MTRSVKHGNTFGTQSVYLSLFIFGFSQSNSVLGCEEDTHGILVKVWTIFRAFAWFSYLPVSSPPRSPWLSLPRQHSSPLLVVCAICPPVILIHFIPSYFSPSALISAVMLFSLLVSHPSLDQIHLNTDYHVPLLHSTFHSFHLTFIRLVICYLSSPTPQVMRPAVFFVPGGF